MACRLLASANASDVVARAKPIPPPPPSSPPPPLTPLTNMYPFCPSPLRVRGADATVSCGCEGRKCTRETARMVSLRRSWRSQIHCRTTPTPQLPIDGMGRAGAGWGGVVPIGARRKVRGGGAALGLGWGQSGRVVRALVGEARWVVEMCGR
ncbi:hypothetical protein ABZP36_003948 [Zizania latifolia]